MASKFYKVFQNITLDKESERYFKDVLVECIKTNSAGNYALICILSRHLIPKDTVYRAENAIQKAYFPDEKTKVEIKERFELSNLYTPETLWKAYKDSIFDELNHISSLSYSFFKAGEIEFPFPDEMVITLPESPVTRRRENEIRGYLRGVFMERCNLAVKLDLRYRDVEENTYREETEHKIARKVEAISERVFCAPVEASDDDAIATYGQSAPKEEKAQTGEKQQDRPKKREAGTFKRLDKNGRNAKGVQFARKDGSANRGLRRQLIPAQRRRCTVMAGISRDENRELKNSVICDRSAILES